MIYKISSTIAPRQCCKFNASPRRPSRISLVRIQYRAGTPTYAFVFSLTVNNEELIWPYPPAQHPIELFTVENWAHRDPKLCKIFPTPLVHIGSQATIGIHNDAPEPLPVEVTFEWEMSQD